ncbi:MAG: hypothetical protein D6766_10975 [Verrucomicrobia bacterium]|nr:MAG: hypothetical protein D6766_10975 [Verrucomicrobiota bacterium]
MTLPAGAEPLRLRHVGADAKWVVHLDVDALLQSRVGKALEAKVGPDLDRGVRELNRHLGVDYDWRRIHGLTLYGSAYGTPDHPKGVLLIHSDLDWKAGFEAALNRQAELGQATDGPVQRLREGPVALFSLDRKGFAALVSKRLAVVGASREEVEQATKVLRGEAPNRRQKADGLEVPRPRDGALLFVVAAEGFASEVPLPPRARVLQMTDALQATVREVGGKLVTEVGLRTKDAQISQQVEQLIQGLKALVALSGEQRPEVQRLAQGLDVRRDGRRVEVSLALPLDWVEQMIREGQPKAD